MDSDLIQQFRDLPRDSGARWQGKFLRMPAWIQGEGEAPYRPVLPLWLDVKYGLISTLQVTRRERAVPDCLLSGLVAFAIEERQYRPGHLEVMDSAVAEYLREALAGCGMSVELVDQMEEMDDIQKELEKYHRQGAPRVASLLSAKSVTVDQLRSFADAAADFFRARLWLHLCDDDLIRIHTPKAPAGMQFAVVLGAGREVYGLGFYATAEEHYRLRNRRSGWQDLPLWQLSYDSVTRLPIEDADLWEDYDLAVADSNAYPTIAQFKRAKVIRPSARELNFMEGLLRVLAVASEEQIDRGRWTKTVACHTSGKTKYTLSIPDLVHPPTPQKWMRRGFIPDPRINEQMLLAVERFFVKNPVSNVERDELGHAAAHHGANAGGIRSRTGNAQREGAGPLLPGDRDVWAPSRATCSPGTDT